MGKDTPEVDMRGVKLAPEEYRLDCNGVLDGDRSKRAQAGLAPHLRKQKHGGKVFFLDSEYVHSMERMHDDYISLAKEVLGKSYVDDDGRDRFKCVFHPFFKRWVFVERWRPKDENDLKKWGHEVWRVFYIVQEDVVKGACPEDYKGDPLREYLTGFVGEFKLPDRRDLEIARDFDMRYRQADDVENYFRALDAESEEVKHDEQWEDWCQDFLSYYFWMAQTDAKAKYENVGKAYSTAQVDVVHGLPVSNKAVDDLKAGKRLMPQRYKTTWKPVGNSGYFVREKMPREEYLGEMIEWLKEQLDTAYQARFPSDVPTEEEKLLAKDLLARDPKQIPDRYRPLVKMQQELEKNLERYEGVNPEQMMVEFAGALK